MKGSRAAWPIALAAALCGCATWKRHGIDLRRSSQLKLALSPVTCSVKTGDCALAASQVDELLRAALSRHEEFELVASTGQAEAVLAVDVGGWGKIKRSWFWWLIGTGAAEGAAQGVLLAQIAGPWAGIGIAAEEVVQESLTWGGGTFLFNRIFTPVILDGKLYSVFSGDRVWTNTAFSRINRKALKKLPKEERKDKAVRLRLTAEKAAAELAKDLAASARRNLKAQRQE